MPETERPGVEHLAGRLDRRSGRIPRTVDRVADDGMADRGEMDADLMRPSGFEPQRDERRGRHPPEDPPVRDGAPPFLAGPGGSPPPVSGVADEIEADRPRVGADPSLDDRHVLALDVVTPEELLESAERLPGTGEHDRARRLLVEAVHDADVGAAPIAVLEVGVDPGEQRVLLVRFGREGQQARRLVDDDERRVLVKDGELRPDVSDRRAIEVERDPRVVADLPARLAADRALDVDPSRLDVVARLASRQRMLAGDTLVEAHAGDCMMAGS
jgi:hypothetical protein